MARRKKTKFGLVIIAAFFLLAIGFCQNNSNKNTTKSIGSSQKKISSDVTEKPTPETITIEIVTTPVVRQDQVNTTIVLPDISDVVVDTVEGSVVQTEKSDDQVEKFVVQTEESDAQTEEADVQVEQSIASMELVSEPSPEVEDAAILEQDQTFTMTFYDASDLKGRGLREYTGEPNYAGTIGYAAVYTEAGLENSSNYMDTPWTVLIYKKIDDTYITNGSITHKTKIGIISQDLTKQNGREYQGFLEFMAFDTGLRGYINVKNYVTIPYWDYEIAKAVTKGYGIAVFKQTSQYPPQYKNGGEATVKENSRVLLLARGTYYISTMNRIDYQIVGVVFVTKNSKIEPQYVFFNKNDLKIVY